MRIVLLTGTRPDIIKMAPLYWEGKKRGHDVILVHSNQHYPYDLFEGVYRDLGLPYPPHFVLNDGFAKKLARKVSKHSYFYDLKKGTQITRKIEKLGAKILSSRPNPANTIAEIIDGLNDLFANHLKNVDIVLVHGDTLTCSAGALSAHLNLIPVGHVEAGLRTGTREPFPEQTNTRIADACSDLRFAAIEKNAKFLEREGFDKRDIHVVGNTVVDAVLWAKDKGNKDFFLGLGADSSKKWIYFSAHRRENLIHEKRFRAIVKAAYDLADMGYQVIWSIRPGTQKYFEDYSISVKHDNIITVKEIPNYTDIVWLMNNCELIVTDSGSMQEEAAALKKPCITLRFVTDRPETVEAGVNFLAEPDERLDIKQTVKKALSVKNFPEIYGKGDSSAKIYDIIEKRKGKFIRWADEK
ncbi:MAG: UDP-N-acetylglucosamine 2-epimerase (non-hydrolyzing) [archaeon]